MRLANSGSSDSKARKQTKLKINAATKVADKPSVCQYVILCCLYRAAHILSTSQLEVASRTYGARRVWYDLLAEGISCGLHCIERLMRLQALKARRDGVDCCPIGFEGALSQGVLSGNSEPAN